MFKHSDKMLTHTSDIYIRTFFSGIDSGKVLCEICRSAVFCSARFIPSLPVISTNKTPFIECIFPLYNQLYLITNKAVIPPP